MLFFFVLPYISTLVLSKPILHNVKSPPLHTSLSNVRSKAQSPEICSNGERSVIVDAQKRSQTLHWDIGSVEAVQTPLACETTMSIDYNAQWQYAVTEINWHGYASLLAGSSATTGLSFGFGPLTPVLPVTLNWLITGPFDSQWDQRFPIPAASQEWSLCGTTSPLTFQWSVQIKPNQRALSSLYTSPGQLGKPTGAGGNLTLAIVSEWRECTQPTAQPTAVQPAEVPPTFRVS